MESGSGSPIVALLLSLVLLAAATAHAEHDSEVCPQASAIVKQTVKSIIRSNKALHGDLLRLHFHDCFLRGCGNDGSVLLMSPFRREEKEADGKLSLRSYEEIHEIKAALESECPGIVSCSDLLALAARDATVQVGGRSWSSASGRKDIFVSSTIEGNPFMSFDPLVHEQNFASVGLNREEMVALSGQVLTSDGMDDDDLCESACKSTEGCTDFLWTHYQGGTCWLKWGDVSEFSPEDNFNSLTDSVCDYLELKAIEWKDGANGVRYAFSCDFNGRDLKAVKMPGSGDQCGGTCASTDGCTHFTWTNFEGGMCWLKFGPVSESNAVSSSQAGAVCGFIKNTNPGLQWQNSGNVRWAFNCDFNDRDLKSVKTNGESCGNTCESTAGCTHFTWTDFNGGTCFMKWGDVTEFNAFYTSAPSAVCGYLKNPTPSPPAPGPPAKDVHGTYWAEQSDGGGCQMPSASYAIEDALALGQEWGLGDLIWRQGLCGQVLEVNCGGQTVQAVVASTCNLNSPSCGVDLIRKTWNKATNNRQPDKVNCKVTKKNTNPINGGSPLCYYRPNSETNNNYYKILGVLNTSGRVSSSAKLAGVDGRRNNDHWFEFNGSGNAFGGDAQVQFFFEDGSSSTFRVSQCLPGGQPHIFR